MLCCVGIVAGPFVGIGTVRADPYSYDLRGTTAEPPLLVPTRKIFAGSRLRGRGRVTGLLATTPLAPSFNSILFSSLDLRKSIAESNAASVAVWGARAAFLPVIDASLNRVKSSDPQTESGSIESRAASIDLSMPLFTSGSRYYGIRSAEAQSMAADYGVRAKENQLLGDTAETYFAVISARERYHALLQSYDRLSTIAEIARARKRQGFADVADVNLAEAGQSGVEREVEAARKQIQAFEIDFSSKTGSRVPLDAALRGDDLLRGYDLAGLVGRALGSNPTIMQAEYSSRAAKYDARSELGKYLPRVDLTGQYKRYLEPALNDRWTVGVKLSMPLVNAASVFEVRRKQLEASSARYAAADTRREVETSIRKTWLTYTSAVRQVAIEERRLKELETAAMAKRKQYRAGFADLTDLLSIENTVLRSKIDRADLIAERQAAAYKLAIAANL